MNQATTNGPAWRELKGTGMVKGARYFTADLPGNVTLWVEYYPERGRPWTVDVARGNAWVARDEDGGTTLATAKRRAMDLATMRRVEVVR